MLSSKDYNGAFFYFLYKIKLDFGYALYLIGSSEELGAWEISQSKRMDCYDEKIWIQKIFLNFSNIELIEYKFFISKFNLDLNNICWIEVEKSPTKNLKITHKELINFSENFLEEKSEKKIKLMSFNILYDNINRGKIYNWENRKNKVLQIITTYKPDILGVQEALPHQSDFLSDKLKNIYNYYGNGRNSDFSGEQSGIFVNKFIYDTLDSGTFWLSDTPDLPGSNTFKGYFPRIVSWVRLREINNYLENRFLNLEKKEVFCFNTHYDHLSQYARINSSFVILNKIEEIFKKIYFGEEKPKENLEVIVFIMGDFNSDDLSTEMSIFKYSGFNSFSDFTNSKDSTFHNYLNEKNIIDRIFFRIFKINKEFDLKNMSFVKDNFTLEKIDKRKIANKNENYYKFIQYEVVKIKVDGIYPSDHFPIFGVIEN